MNRCRINQEEAQRREVVQQYQLQLCVYMRDDQGHIDQDMKATDVAVCHPEARIRARRALRGRAGGRWPARSP